MLQALSGSALVYRKVQEEMKADRGLRIGRMVELGGVSHAGFYRFDSDRRPPPDSDMDLRDAIQRIALEWPSTVGRRSRLN